MELVRELHGRRLGAQSGTRSLSHSHSQLHHQSDMTCTTNKCLNSARIRFLDHTNTRTNSLNSHSNSHPTCTRRHIPPIPPSTRSNTMPLFGHRTTRSTTTTRRTGRSGFRSRFGRKDPDRVAGGYSTYASRSPPQPSPRPSSLVK